MYIGRYVCHTKACMHACIYNPLELEYLPLSSPFNYTQVLYYTVRNISCTTLFKQPPFSILYHAIIQTDFFFETAFTSSHVNGTSAN